LSMHSRVARVISAVAIALFVAAPAFGQAPPSAYIAAGDKDGNAGAGLTAPDLDFKIAGKPVAITNADLATKKMRIALIIADGGIGAFQQSMATVIEKLHSVAEFKIVAVVDQPNVVLDWTTDAEKLVDAVTKLGARTAVKGSSQTMEAI